MKVIDKYGREVDVPFIDENGCHNRGEHICNLGYACDGCPYNKDFERGYGTIKNCPYCGKTLIGKSRRALFKGKQRILFGCKYCGMPYYVVMPKSLRIEWMIYRIGGKRGSRLVLAKVKFEEGGDEILEYMELERVMDAIKPIRG